MTTTLAAVTLDGLVPILQGAVGPVILVSGVGLLLLSMTNRFGRVLDRSRQFADLLRNDPATEGPRIRAQLDILTRRAYLLRTAITLATVSLLTAALLVISLFLAAFLGVAVELLGAILFTLFILCMISLIGSLLVFLLDINRSLSALQLELKSIEDPHPPSLEDLLSNPRPRL